jgi:hypothetical protein
MGISLSMEKGRLNHPAIAIASRHQRVSQCRIELAADFDRPGVFWKRQGEGQLGLICVEYSGSKMFGSQRPFQKERRRDSVRDENMVDQFRATCCSILFDELQDLFSGWGRAGTHMVTRT